MLAFLSGASEQLRADLFESLPDGVRLTTPTGSVVRVQVCAERIFRVTALPVGQAAIPESYVVNKKWARTEFFVDSPDSQHVQVRTASLSAKLDRTTGVVEFFDAKGHPVLRERGRIFPPVTVNSEKTLQVEQAFDSPRQEALFGLGQHQTGQWNWQGQSLDFQQVNTDVCIPFYVSTRGYGLLWDNASNFQFNPIDQAITLTRENPEPAAGPHLTASEREANIGKLAKEPTPIPVWTGNFTTREAGEYVFFAKNGDTHNELSISVEGKPVVGITNLWVPTSATGSIELPAARTVKVTLRGSQKGIVLAARRRDSGQTVLRSEVGNGVDYTFFYGPSLDEVIAGYRTATGAAPLLPRWAYGFWQCRERYDTQDEMMQAARQYRREKIPIDLIVQDWKYWGKYGWGAYRYDETKFPDPAAMIRELHELNIKYMVSIWPNPSGEAHDALALIPHGLLVADKNEKRSFYDVFNPVARALRWKFVNQTFFQIGADAWWQDAAEGLGNGLQTARGSGNRDVLAYPFFHSQGVYEGQRTTNPEKRVVNLTRSAYLGQQRFATIVWSGDVKGDWLTFARQIPAGLNFSLSGQPFWTTDAGGFFRPPNPNRDKDHNELQARWFAWSTFCPIQRIHGYKTKTEFWEWLPQTRDALIAFDRLRYRFLPYNYSVGWQVTHRGSTMMRPLVMDFPQDARAVATSDAYLFGPALLVTPVTTAQATSRVVYLPLGTHWLDFWTGENRVGGSTCEVPVPWEQIPLQVRAGSIVPLGPDLQYANEKAADPLELRVYPGADGDFTLYEDEGDSYRYEQGAGAEIPLHWDDAKHLLTLGAREGRFPGMLEKRTFRIVRVFPGHGVGPELTVKADREIVYDGSKMDVSIPSQK